MNFMYVLNKPATQYTNDELRSFWREQGGKFHGPIVETATMEESKLLPLLRLLIVSRGKMPKPVAWRYRLENDLQWQYTEREEIAIGEIQPVYCYEG